MNRKIILITLLIVIVVAVSAIGYFTFVKKSTPYASKKECEQKTGEQCYLFKGLCQVGEAQNQKEAEENEKFLRECLPKIGTWQPVEKKIATETNYLIDGVEDGGYSGTAFCNLIKDFKLDGHLVTISGDGPYEMKINEMRNTFFPFEYPNVKLITHIIFENKDVSYADTLYFGNDGNLYNCHGSK